jgi:succinate-acetate transporter protein
LAKVADVPVQIVLRPYASSIPLASLAFGVGNVLYGAFLLHWIPQSEARLVALMLLAFVAPLELGPSLMAFLARDAGGATAFAIFGAAWVVQGLSLLGGPPPATSPATGLFLICLTLCVTILAVVTFKGKPLLGIVLVVAIIRTSGEAASAFTPVPWVATATGWCGLLLALLAFYSALAFLEEDVTQRLSPLTFRTGEARAALEGDFKDQVSTIEKEAGVRKQL